MDWPSGLGGVGGRGRASTHEAFSWVGGYKSSVLNLTKKLILSFFGAGRGVPGRRRQRPRMAWPSGLGGVEGRGRASTLGSRAQGAGVEGVRAEGIGVRVWGREIL